MKEGMREGGERGKCQSGVPACLLTAPIQTSRALGLSRTWK